MAQQINTILVLRNDQTTNWEKSTIIMQRGEVGIGYLDNGNIIAKVGDGVHSWKDLSQLEGVFEDGITLTHDFGRYKINNGFVKAEDAKGMTTSQWLVHALSEVLEPEIIQPTFTLTASGTGAGGEIGSNITALKWNGNTTYGSYEYGPATGLTESDVTWTISNNIDIQTATTEDGTFILTSDNQIQLTQEASKVYATITGTYKLNAANAASPMNNVGIVTAGKITDKEGTIEASVSATAYRKPFWGVLAAGQALDISALTSADIRNLSSSGTSNTGLPTTLSVPVGTQMVIIAAKAGVRDSLVATDSKAMNAEVTFTKIPAAVQVEGANGFEATDYDIWYVDWNPDKIESYTGIDSAKLLKLTWA